VADDRTTHSTRPAGFLGARQGVLISLEGVWGAGKTTQAQLLGDHLRAQGYRTAVLHYGQRHGVIADLSRFLDTRPLRRRHVRGGYDQPHHAVVDVLLRQAREARNHTHLYTPALVEHDVVVLDHGVYSKFAYALTVLTEESGPHKFDHHLERLRTITGPWFLHPARAFHLDLPWRLARERAIARGTRGADSLERELFLPRYDTAYRYLTTQYTDRIVPVPAAQPTAEVARVIAEHTEQLLYTSNPRKTRPCDE